MDATVVIPTYNRREARRETLEGLVRRDYPQERWQVLVVDDGSTDGTGDAVRNWAEGRSLSVEYLEQPNSGPAAARNRGAAAARGRVLIFIDNDILVEP